MKSLFIPLLFLFLLFSPRIVLGQDVPKETKESKTEPKDPKGCIEDPVLGYYLPSWVSEKNKIYLTCPNVRVGIGTNFPTTQFHATGSGLFDNDLKVGGNGFYGGNLGLGTSNPAQRLDINGNIVVRNDIYGYRSGSWGLRMFAGSSPYNGAYIGVFPNNASTGKQGDVLLSAGNHPSANIDFVHWKNGSQTLSMTVLEGGLVGIGTDQIPNGYSLAVNGKVICEEVRVREYQNWPDFVFLPDYTMMSLYELEQYIQQENHLPNVPSAAEVSQSGYDVGEMNAILLQKIEELTLHVIDLQKQIDELQEN